MEQLKTKAATFCPFCGQMLKQEKDSETYSRYCLNQKCGHGFEQHVKREF